MCVCPTLRTSSGLPATSDCAKANVLNEQFQSVFTDEDMENLPSCKKLFPDMTEINFDIDGIIKQLQKINPNKANGQIPKRNRDGMRSYVSSSVLSVIPAWHTTISLDSCFGMSYL